ncbi:hypothetical protein K470DRAFT_269385 [Piedraia hortae CBS 480.64]|uniref:RFX-type winged-helix domain-containing protein n=1 Tax=Piedraia hortae CBS 480.64 TaxID=1314780 RepID=A0A6A7C3C8_9PEZI|nr:hypothetical protein K470DRAFT_269385 [Piedraia hortae CBS 480.64]
MASHPLRDRSHSRPQSRASTMSAASHRTGLVPVEPHAYVQEPTHMIARFPPEFANTHVMNQQPPMGQRPLPGGPPFHVVQEQPFVYTTTEAYMGHPRAPSQPQASNGAESGENKKGRGSAVTASNDKELRELLNRNENRTLHDVAHEVINNDRSPMAEKTKQLFAMLWLRDVCKPAKSSVPRNRVYSQYASCCGTERVVPLNPASFGKLVRVIFPGIKTRRLGVRGESKYHYVNLALSDENPPPVMVSPMEQPQRNEPTLDFNGMPRLQADTAAFPSAGALYERPAANAVSSIGRAFAMPETAGMQLGSAEAVTYEHALRFPPAKIPDCQENEPVVLPSLNPYLPHRADPDAASALYALYRTHCTSLVDSIRYCKEKQFFRLYTSFHGTLTVPVQKLFTHPNMAPWIEQCDLVMYRTMVRFVKHLALQAAPVIVIKVLSSISATLYSHIAKTFASQPPHVLEAKLRPATIFASLLYRLLRVNQSAHAAANLLTIDENREQMWHEWVTCVNPKRVMESELPNCGYEEVYRILTVELRTLMEPLKTPGFDTNDPFALGTYNIEDNTANLGQFLSGHGGPEVTGNVLDRWDNFLQSLPSRFPHASVRTILQCISTIGTAALRDIVIMNGASYGHWFVLKIFVDEMSLWKAELGGFLDMDETPPAGNLNGFLSQPPQQQQPQGHMAQMLSMSNMAQMTPQGIQCQNMPPQQDMQQGMQPQDIPHQQGMQSQGITHQGIPPQGIPHQPTLYHENNENVDDSGIGLGLDEDDLQKYSHAQTQAQQHV